MRKIFLYCTVACIAAFSPLFAQEVPAAHEMLLNDKVSKTGKVVSFYSFVNGKSALMMKDLKRGKDYILPGINAETVLTERFLMAHNYTDSILYTVNFNRSAVDSLKRVTRLERIGESSSVIVEHNGGERLTIIHGGTEQTKTFDNIKGWFHTEGGQLYLLDTLNGITRWDTEIFRAKKLLQGIPPGYSVKKILTHESVPNAYAIAGKSDSIYFFRINDMSAEKVFQYAANTAYGNFRTDTLFRKTRLLKNGYIVLGTVPVVAAAQKGAVEVWKSADNYLVNETDKKWRTDKRFIIVDTSQKRIIDMGGTDRNSEFVINDYDNRVYELEMDDPEFLSKQFSDVKLYNVDTETQLRQFAGMVNGANYTMYQTARLPYFFYFNGQHWFYYDPAANRHVNLTQGLDDTFYNLDNEFASVKKDEGYRSFGIMGSTLVFNGYRDIWFLDTVSGKLRKITDGKKEGVRYSVDDSSFKSQKKNFTLNYENEVPQGSSLLVKWVKDDYAAEGFALIDKKGIVRDLISEEAHLSQVQWSGDYFTYVRERADTPPQLYRYDLKKKTAMLLYSSNTSDTAAGDIISSYISFANSQGKKRGAVVRFSKNLKSGQKYPAIVNIYEKKYKKRHQYTSPYEIIGGEINVRKYIEDGYIVIEPDIYYEMGNTGISAAENVRDVLDEVIKRFPVDEELLGIFGHSFGGYEANFIITQTNRFKAAVSSAGVADLRSFYFTVNWETVKADMWRMETQQWRMGRGYYEIPGSYADNSPIEHIEKVQTPLLLISGKADYQINWQQSVMMFLAMKRLKKETELLFYPGEGHVLMKKENQLDADKRIKQWFDKYLKK